MFYIYNRRHTRVSVKLKINKLKEDKFKTKIIKRNVNAANDELGMKHISATLVGIDILRYSLIVILLL